MRLCVLLLALSVCVTLQVRAHEEDEDDDVHVEDNLVDEELLDGDGDVDLEEEEEKPTPTPAAPTVRLTTPSIQSLLRTCTIEIGSILEILK